jgi:hypothetical protein
MAQAGQRKCLSCGEFFFPDQRNLERQRYCAKSACRRVSKAASQAAWLAAPRNADYFCGPVHVARVQAWRAAHPGYSRAKPRKASALQDALISQALDSTGDLANRGGVVESPAEPALQDSLIASSPVLLGLIAHLFSLSLQDDMDETIRRLVKRGREMTHRSGGEELQAGVAGPAAALGARAVQLA